MTRALVLVSMALSACSTQPTEELGPGLYAGSTARDAAVTISVGGSSIFVNHKKTELDSVIDNRRFTVKKEPEQRATFVDASKWACRPVLDGDELRCDVTWADGTRETIELMKE